ASRWPPVRASVHTALGGRKDADRPTSGTGTESVAESYGGQRRSCPPGGAAAGRQIVGWSKLRVGLQSGLRCTPHSAAGKTPTALHQAQTRSRSQIRSADNVGLVRLARQRSGARS